ncbi:MAG: hypothetical protein ACXWCZ_02960 [Flavisolibacter sp.]
MGNISAMELMIILFALMLIPAIFYLLTQQNTLKSIRPENRFMSPGEVWLQLIPLFGIVWQFIVVTRIAKSIKKELASGDQFSFDSNTDGYIDLESDRPTYQIGIAMCILLVASIIPVLGILFSIAGLVCWIIYWVKLSQYKNQIEQKNYTVYSNTH